jgi:uncharacterized protein (TIGR03437 family)
MLALLKRAGNDFTFKVPDGQVAVFATTDPWPTTLGDVQVFVNGVPSPIFHVLTNRIDFQVPYATPESGTAEYVVVRASTKEILAVGSFQMTKSAPGFFTLNSAGTGQIIAANDDGTLNSPTNPIRVGHIITFVLTGAGNVPNAPPDGASPSGALPTPTTPVIAMNPGGQILQANILYSGLGEFAGGYQINVKIPDTAVPSNTVQLFLLLNDTPSNKGPNGQTIVTTFAIR